MKRESTKYLVVHGAWTPPQMDVGAGEIRQWHLDKGWRDIGYHYVIPQSGRLQGGREIDERGIHVRGHNYESLGICLVGGMPRDLREDWQWDFTYTRAQMRTLRALLGQLEKLYPGARVRGHRDFDGVSKLCPGFDVRAWWYG